MASFKAVVLKHQMRGDATFGIKIRLTHNRRSRYINTDLVATKSDITKSLKLKNHFFIDETENIIKKYRDICNKNAFLLKGMEIGQVLDLITKYLIFTFVLYFLLSLHLLLCHLTLT